MLTVLVQIIDCISTDNCRELNHKRAIFILHCQHGNALCYHRDRAITSDNALVHVLTT